MNMYASRLPPPLRRNLPIPTDQNQLKTSIWRIIVDIISLSICKKYFSFENNLNSLSFLSVLAITLIAHFVAKPFTRGFFCSDTSIQYPYKSNTIPTSAAVILSIGLPILWVRY